MQTPWQTLEQLYPALKTAEMKIKVLEDEMKRRFEESKEERWDLSGLCITSKERTSYDYKPEIYAYLDEERSLLPLSVSFDGLVKKQFPVERYKVGWEPSLRFYATFKKTTRLDPDTPSLTEAEKDWDHHVKSLSTESMVPLIRLYRMKHKQHTQQYEECQQNILTWMEKENTSTHEEPGIGKFRILEKSPQYDIDAMYETLRHRYAAFWVRYCTPSVAVVEDMFTKELVIVDGDTPHRGMVLTVANRTLYINGVKSENSLFDENHMPWYPVKWTQKEEKQRSSLRFVPQFATIPCTWEEFLYQCPISSTKLTALMDQGILMEKEITPFKTVSDVTHYTEIIEELKDKIRKEHFHSQLMVRAQAFRNRNETATFLKEESS